MSLGECYFILWDSRSHEFKFFLIAFMKQLVTLDGKVKLAVSGIREALWGRLVCCCLSIAASHPHLCFPITDL